MLRSAHQLGYDKFFRGGTYPVEDDHSPFPERGVSAVDIIDLTSFQSYHHTDQDTLRGAARKAGRSWRVVLATLDGLERKLQ